MDGTNSEVTEEMVNAAARAAVAEYCVRSFDDSSDDQYEADLASTRAILTAALATRESSPR